MVIYKELARQGRFYSIKQKKRSAWENPAINKETKQSYCPSNAIELSPTVWKDFKGKTVNNPLVPSMATRKRSYRRRKKWKKKKKNKPNDNSYQLLLSPAVPRYFEFSKKMVLVRDHLVIKAFGNGHTVLASSHKSNCTGMTICYFYSPSFRQLNESFISGEDIASQIPQHYQLMKNIFLQEMVCL